MHKLGLNRKLMPVILPSDGYPKIICKERILQGEVLETFSAHDIAFADADKLCLIAPTFLHCVQPNPVKLKGANQMADELYKTLIADILKNGDPTQEQLDEIRSDPRVFELFHSIKWMDVLIGHLPYYLENPIPNSNIIWNEKLNLWQTVAIREIQEEEVLTIMRKSDL